MKKVISTLTLAGFALLSTPAAHADSNISDPTGTLDGVYDQYRSSIVSKPEAHAWLGMHPNAPIVVLGARLNPDGTMPNILVERLDEAIKQSRLHPTNPIMVSGGHTQPAVPYAEADAMYSYLVDNLVAPWRITKETQAGSTVGNAQFYYQTYPSAPGAVLITNQDHMLRALNTFESVAPNQVFKGLIVS